MEKFFLSVLGRFIDTRSLGSAVIVTTVLLSVLYIWGSRMVNDASFFISEPVYFILAADLEKQINKLAKDPEDFKQTDLSKFTRFCTAGDPFIDRYIPSRPDARFLSGACNRLLRMADQQVGVNSANIGPPG